MTTGHAPAASPLGSGLWTRLHAVATMMKSGGMEVITPPGAGEDDPVDVRSLIQFDGDMVTSVVESRLGDREIFEQHFAGVHALLADLDRLRRELLAFVVGSILLIPSLWSVATFLASADRDWVAICWALTLHVVSSGVIATAAAAARRWILGRALGWAREEFGVSVRDRLFPDEAARLF